MYLCVLLVSGLLFAFVLLIGGTRDSLRLVQQRLGADVVVVPAGTETEIESALLMGHPVKAWMPRENQPGIARVPGVRTVSPQLYLASLANAPCCTAEMLVMAFDPQTDFTIAPWLKQHLGHGLHVGEAVGGSDVFVPYGEEHLRIYRDVLDGNIARLSPGVPRELPARYEPGQP